MLLGSGDTRNVIHQYDISNMNGPAARVEASSEAGSPSWSNYQHDVRTYRREGLHACNADKTQDSLRSISCHPEQDNLFLSAASARLAQRRCRVY